MTRTSNNLVSAETVEGVDLEVDLGVAIEAKVVWVKRVGRQVKGVKGVKEVKVEQVEVCVGGVEKRGRDGVKRKVDEGMVIGSAE